MVLAQGDQWFNYSKLNIGRAHCNIVNWTMWQLAVQMTKDIMKIDKMNINKMTVDI
jgi:hypothetical protein